MHGQNHIKHCTTLSSELLHMRSEVWYILNREEWWKVVHPCLLEMKAVLCYILFRVRGRNIPLCQIL